MWCLPHIEGLKPPAPSPLAQDLQLVITTENASIQKATCFGESKYMNVFMDNPLESQGPLQACSGKALPLPFTFFLMPTKFRNLKIESRLLLWSEYVKIQ